jgi:hypothetical protein
MKRSTVRAFLSGPLPPGNHQKCWTCSRKPIAKDIAEFVAEQRAGRTTVSLSAFWRNYLVPKYGKDIPRICSVQKHVRNCL